MRGTRDGRTATTSGKPPDREEGTMAIEPPDLKRCQATFWKQEFFRLGDGGKRVRCENAATVVAIEKDPGPDGMNGIMSMCDDCRAVFTRQNGEDGVVFVPAELFDCSPDPDQCDHEFVESGTTFVWCCSKCDKKATDLEPQ